MRRHQLPLFTVDSLLLKGFRGLTILTDAVNADNEAIAHLAISWCTHEIESYAATLMVPLHNPA